ncbi:hypothetical protein [Georgenia sp. MJ206]|uniref:hypothetical protein n=1 Tax=Georgenia wangjunii TaxID=3117730 RepID=UPI002F26009B
MPGELADEGLPLVGREGELGLCALGSTLGVARGVGERRRRGLLGGESVVGTTLERGSHLLGGLEPLEGVVRLATHPVDRRRAVHRVGERVGGQERLDRAQCPRTGTVGSRGDPPDLRPLALHLGERRVSLRARRRGGDLGLGEALGRLEVRLVGLGGTDAGVVHLGAEAREVDLERGDLLAGGGLCLARPGDLVLIRHGGGGGDEGATGEGEHGHEHHGAAPPRTNRHVSPTIAMSRTSHPCGVVPLGPGSTLALNRHFGNTGHFSHMSNTCRSVMRNRRGWPTSAPRLRTASARPVAPADRLDAHAGHATRRDCGPTR